MHDLTEKTLAGAAFAEHEDRHVRFGGKTFLDPGNFFHCGARKNKISRGKRLRIYRALVLRRIKDRF